MIKGNTLSRNIIIALVLGAVVGTFFPEVSPYVSWMGLGFKLALQMIAMPIVLTSILCGLESIGDIRNLAGLGKRALLYYFSTTLMAILIGLILVCTIEPGVGPTSLEVLKMAKDIPGQAPLESRPLA